MVTGTAAARNQPPKALPDKPQAEPLTPRIEIDEDEGVLRILTGGTERVRIYADGLHVKGDIEYTGSITDLSDARLKAGVRPLADQREALLSLRPVAFTMADDPWNRTEYGLLAQEVEPVYPAVVQTRADGAKAVNYTGLIAPPDFRRAGTSPG